MSFSMPQPRLPAALFLLTLCTPTVPLLAAPRAVALMRAPGGGLQPQAVVDGRGALHLIYFRGDPAGGDVFYVRKGPEAGAAFSGPLRVNSVSHSAIAIGAIRGPQIAVGQDDRVHVSWNGVGPKGANGYARLYVAYARLNDVGTAFEPQRNLLGAGEEVDGGGSVAADGRGHVYVTWHSSPPGGSEAAGAVFLARSGDGGRTFARARKISVRPTGQCGCCSMRAFVDRAGGLFVLYRAAGGGFDRDTTLLVSGDGGTTFRSTVLGRWKLGACPMSSFALAEAPSGVLGAWETAGQVYRAPLSGGAAQVPVAMPAPGTGERKYPAVASNTRGETLLAWVEGAGWGHGGSLAWQVYDKNGVAEGPTGRTTGVPTWSLISAATRPDGSFLLVY